MKDDISEPEQSTFTDSDTGARLRQMTNHASISHPTYFLQSSFFPGDASLVFTSYRTGSSQLFEVTFPEGTIRQMTDGDPIHPFSPAIHPSGECVVFVRGGSIWSVDARSLKEQLVATFQGAQLGECSLGGQGEWITAAIKHGSKNGLVTGRSDGRHWRIIPFERTVIHPQFHPLEPEWLIFAADPAPRMFRVRRDGTDMECLYRHGNDEFILHETFLGETGDIAFVHWPHALRRMNWRSREISTIVEFNAWHITSNQAGTKVLCDTNHPDLGLFLIDAATGERHKVCRSDASGQGSQWRKSSYALNADFEAARSGAKQNLSWMETPADAVYGPQWTHPHPSFSHDERLVAFASDRTGMTQVYVTELAP